jgi:hypothetical protein
MQGSTNMCIRETERNQEPMMISDDVATLIRECQNSARTLAQKYDTTHDWEEHMVDDAGAILTACAVWMKAGVTSDESKQLEDNEIMLEHWEAAGITPEQVKEFHAVQIPDATIVDFLEDPKSVFVWDIIES